MKRFPIYYVARAVLLIVCVFTLCQLPARAEEDEQALQDVRDLALYIPMRDGVRIAVDVLLPKDLRIDQKLPALFKISSFGRAPLDGTVSEEDRFWVQHGFARVLVDERGTGASFGTSVYGPAMIPDLYDIVDWVMKQPWSNGRVGALGISVEGNAAELLAATNHPAVRAVAPWFNDWNYYTDLVRPGGLFNEWILRNFEEFTRKEDAGASAKPVDGDQDSVLLKQAIAEHRNNIDIYSSEQAAPFADDPVDNTHKSLLDLSVAGALPLLKQSHVPMLILSSWNDAGTVQGTIQRFQTLPNGQEGFVGAWSHGGKYAADPLLRNTTAMPSGQQQELQALAFFSRYLKDEQSPTESVRTFAYYTMGTGRWQSTETWPPKGMAAVTYHLDAKSLSSSNSKRAMQKVRMQPASTGEHNRWITQLGGGLVDYNAVVPQMQKLPSFVTLPFDTSQEMTGQPVLRLRMSCINSEDPSVVAYLFAVDPSGKSFYLTEGHLRLIDRKLDSTQQTLHSFARQDALPVRTGQQMQADLTFFPVSVILRKGYRLELVLSSGDEATFSNSGAYTATISSESTLELPVRRTKF